MTATSNGALVAMIEKLQQQMRGMALQLEHATPSVSGISMRSAPPSSKKSKDKDAKLEYFRKKYEHALQTQTLINGSTWTDDFKALFVVKDRQLTGASANAVEVATNNFDYIGDSDHGGEMLRTLSDRNLLVGFGAYIFAKVADGTVITATQKGIPKTFLLTNVYHFLGACFSPYRTLCHYGGF
ncbi:hypothetical protein PPTG_22458 [Phytophthora nicotianae INRA-310]|uniref:Uncharacterized protein n=1 Tax=Phytophthora nicotianae (strain INRA-310) TaxID=761204 RepID=W2QHY0_PHYN3|nr:hypothetical protein PPTG_22458 [Phytophthora nicotianae INRA-310]ETN12154.1 hypothetical protein PPTG_22458 [Phytophthora nicotianae INRA-310]